jgi:cobalt-zinc-cadmium efflux system membrane fusion protein
MKNYLILFIILFVIACKPNQNPEESPTKEDASASENTLTLTNEQLKAFPISTTSLSKNTVSGKLILTGKIDVNPDHIASLSSAMGGYVKSIRVMPGNMVRKGEVLLILEDNEFIQIQQDYLTVKAQLLSATPNFQRQKELNESRSSSDKTMQLAETEYRSLLAAKSALEEKLKLININPVTLTIDNIRSTIPVFAPFNGTISEVFINKGKYVAPSDILIELFNPDGLLLKMKVFEKDWSKVSVGQVVEANMNNTEQSIKAEIIAVGSFIAKDGSTEVIAKITNSRSVKLAVGLFINAIVLVKNYTTYTLPEEAVVSFDESNYVFHRLYKNHFNMLKVDLGASSNGFVEVVNSDSLINKNIVKEGAYTLLMALKNTSE